MSSNFVKGEDGVIEVFRIEMSFISARERYQKGRKVALMEHWFRNKNEFRKMLFGEMS